MPVKEDPVIKEFRKNLMDLTKDLGEAIKDISENDYDLRKAQIDKLIKQEEAYREDLERNIGDITLKVWLENQGKIDTYREHSIQENAKEELKKEIELLKTLSKKKKKEQEKEVKKLQRDKKTATYLSSDKKSDRAKGELRQWSDKRDHAEDVRNKLLKGIHEGIQQGLNAINNAVSAYAKYQLTVNTRLQGTGKTFSTISNNLAKVAYSPLIKTEDLYNNLSTLVSEGVASNVEQRAFLMTIADGVAATFDANSPALRKLIRIQQEDSTAARLGMEAYLTRWLNEYVENTEYLTSTFDQVAENLLEASSLIGQNGGAAASTEFEYVVQKWLGALSGVGLSDNATTAIASAINELGSGNISNLGSGVQNLLAMAASQVGLSYSALLSEGLDAIDTNLLMAGVVDYMQKIASSGSNIVKNQLANLFGINVSDLVAIKNFDANDIETIYNNAMSYGSMYSELSSQMGKLREREGIATILENAMANFTYQTGMGIASNPMTYATWKITDLIQGVTGGINIPSVFALGTGVDLNTTVENLMKILIVGGSTLGQIGNIVNGINSVGNGSSLLTALSISQGNNAVNRGSGLSDYTITSANLRKRTSGTTTSASTYVGNTNSDAYYSSTLNSSYDQANSTLDQAVEETKDIVSYLDDVDFSSGFKSIVDNIQSLTDNGINIKSITDTGFTSMTSFYKRTADAYA